MFDGSRRHFLLFKADRRRPIDEYIDYFGGASAAPDAASAAILKALADQRGR